MRQWVYYKPKNASGQPDRSRLTEKIWKFDGSLTKIPKLSASWRIKQSEFFTFASPEFLTIFPEGRFEDCGDCHVILFLAMTRHGHPCMLLAGISLIPDGMKGGGRPGNVFNKDGDCRLTSFFAMTSYCHSHM
jgi:hypothetical protein